LEVAEAVAVGITRRARAAVGRRAAAEALLPPPIGDAVADGVEIDRVATALAVLVMLLAAVGAPTIVTVAL
jgi:hypothetical protein